MSQKIILFLLVSFSSLFSQHQLFPSNIKIPLQTTEFNKQNTTWNWYGRIYKDIQTKTGWNVNVSETFQSNLIQPSVRKEQWKDENRFNGSFFWNTNGNAIGIYANSWLQTDKQAASDRRFGNHSLGAFGRYNIRQKVNLEPYIARQNSQYREISDWGWDMGIKGDAHNIALEEYELDLDLSADYDLYEKRKNYENYLDLNIQTDFNQYTSDSLQLSYKETFKQHYTATGGNLLEAHLFDRSLRNKLIYRMAANRRLDFTTTLTSTDISYITNRKTFLLENQVRFLWFSERFFYGFTFRTNDQTQDVSDILSDVQSAQTAMSLNGMYQWNADNRLFFDLAYVKFQYDTPEENNDDRDEQRFIMNLNYFHRFSPFLFMEWKLYTRLYHQIYLFNPQSQNNNWNRIINLNPIIYYRSDKLTNKISSSVLANYTVYDFDSKLTGKSSFIFRKYTLSDSLMIPLYRQIGVVFLGKIELEDKGSFFKDQFTQQIVQSYRSNLFNVQLVYENILNMRVALGYSSFTRREWRHLPRKALARKIANNGPFLNLSYSNEPGLIVSAYVALSTLNDSNTGRNIVSTGQLKLYYNF